MQILGFRIEKDMTSFGVPVWICCYGYYLHIETSFLGLMKSALLEYKHERHIVG